jgi:hypothetical protein
MDFTAFGDMSNLILIAIRNLGWINIVIIIKSSNRRACTRNLMKVDAKGVCTDRVRFVAIGRK